VHGPALSNRSVSTDHEFNPTGETAAFAEQAGRSNLS